MRVLVITNMYPTATRPWWGPFVAEQVRDLRRLGVDVDVLVIDGSKGKMEYVRARARLARALGRSTYDVVHAHYGLTGAVAITQSRCPVVTTFHGGDYTGLTSWHRAVSRLVARFCTPVVVSSDGAESLGVRTARVIPVGVDLERFVPTDQGEARRALGWEPCANYVLLLGRRDDPNKRADIFDAAIARLRRTMPTVWPAALEGFGRAQVALAMNAADVGVLPSDTEGSPVAVKEALACGTPVVASRVGDLPVMLSGLPGCSVSDREPGALARAIRDAITTGKSQELRHRAAEYSGVQVAKRLVRVYEEILSGQRRR